MFWALKRTISMSEFFWAKHMIKSIGKKKITILGLNVLLYWPNVKGLNHALIYLCHDDKDRDVRSSMYCWNCQLFIDLFD